MNELEAEKTPVVPALDRDGPRTVELSSIEAPTGTWQPGDRVGRFVLQDELGGGGMGVVFRAVDPADGTVAALKILRPEVAESENIRSRFVKEARLLASLDSPFITRLIEANAQSPPFFIALEFVDGESLGTVLRSAGKLDETTALNYIADAARGLAAAHNLQIVHRDIKPDNLLVCRAAGSGPRLKVTDFGLGRPVLQAESLMVTNPGSIIGTPLYMAPEQFGAGAADTRADVYSLGSTLFHMLAGQPPFPMTNLAMLARSVTQDPPPLLDRVNRAVGAPTAAFVARCLSKDPADRPADANAFLRAVEAILNGNTDEVESHPLTPVGAGRVIEYVHTWELNSPREHLWPYVSNTERLNRAVGLPAPKYELRHDPDFGPRRFAKARVVGFTMEWEEHPFEWIEGRRMGILREYVRGPFKWFLSVLELLPGPRGGTVLKHTLRAEPRGWLGRIAGPIELGIKARKSLGRTYRRIDEVLARTRGAPEAEDAFESQPSLSRAGARRLQAGVAHLRAAGISADAIDSLAAHLTRAPAQELARIKPLVVARRFGIDGIALAEACLRAVPAGLLELQWDIICPLCRLPALQRSTLQQLREHETCTACASDFQADFTNSVELVFGSHPDVRLAEPRLYCAGGPAHSPHVVAQTRLSAGEEVELELRLSQGAYRIRGPKLPWTLSFAVEAGAGVRKHAIQLDAAEQPPMSALDIGGQILVLRNGRAHETVLRVERTTETDDALTAARAALLPAFRELFPGELLSPGQLAPAAAVTLLMAQLHDVDALVETRGESGAFQVIHAACRAIEDRVRANGGTVVKAVGEGLLAAFGDAASAVRTALSLAAAIEADPVAAGHPLQVAVHRGLARIATINDRLDYFGSAVKTTARLLDAAKGNELLVSSAAAGDHEIATLLGNRPIELEELNRSGRTPLFAYRVELSVPPVDGMTGVP